jgi:hypothetical protein
MPPPTPRSRSPSAASEGKLLARRAALQQQSEAHSRQFEAAQAALMQARAAEEARGGVPGEGQGRCWAGTCVRLPPASLLFSAHPPTHPASLHPAQAVAIAVTAPVRSAPHAGDARRWNGVRTVVQARALLKTVFRAASQHRASAAEAAAQLTELGDEMELLRLRLDIAEQEKCEAAERAAEAHALLTAAQQAAERDVGERRGGTDDGGPAEVGVRAPRAGMRVAARGGLPVPASLPACALTDPAPAALPRRCASPQGGGLLEAHQILHQLNALAAEASGGAAEVRLLLPPPPCSPASAAARGADVAELVCCCAEPFPAAAALCCVQGSGGEETSDEEGSSDEEEEEDAEEEEEEEQSEDEERHALWDPSLATPARGPKHRRNTGGSASGEGAPGQRRRRRRSSPAAAASAPLLPEEQPVLTHLNEQLALQGREAVPRPTVALMKEVLRGRVVHGQRWRLGSKKREDLVRDYRWGALQAEGAWGGGGGAGGTWGGGGVVVRGVLWHSQLHWRKQEEGGTGSVCCVSRALKQGGGDRRRRRAGLCR